MQSVRALTDAPSKSAIVQARIAVLLVAGLIILGVAWYGVSAENLGRLWSDILDRPTGPMMFRFILQPTMAIIAALRDGVKDARLGRRPYIWALIHGAYGPEGRGGRSVGGDHLDGADCDSWRRHGYHLPMEGAGHILPGPVGSDRDFARVCSLFLLRGPIARIARHWVAHPASS